jgi:hypothetical protein
VSLEKKIPQKKVRVALLLIQQSVFQSNNNEGHKPDVVVYACNPRYCVEVEAGGL